MSNGTDHVGDHPLIRSLEHELETVPALGAVREDWEEILEMMRRDAARSHGEALLIMHDYKATKRPFALFLRSFEVEAYDYLTPEGPAAGERKVSTVLAGASSVERKLAAALAGRLGVIGIANPSQLATHRGVIPRLQLPNEGWQAVAQQLIEHAHLIVIDCDSLAPGVLWELETIKGANRQDATVLVLPSGEGADADIAFQQEMAELTGAHVVKRERPTKETAELSAFRRVASEDEIFFDRLDSSPLFADLLAAAVAAAAAAQPFDPMNYAKGLNNTGVALFNEKRYADALDLLQQALLLRRHLDDRAGLQTTLFNIGCVYMDGGQPADALPAFTESLKLAGELTRPEEQGILASYIGAVYQQLGQLEEARQWLAAAFQAQREHGKPSDVENTLTQLSKVYETTGDGDGMVACFETLRSLHRQRGDRAGELRATLRLGITYHSAGHIETSARLFEEGARLSRELGDQESEEACAAMLKRIQADASTA